jgi:hypothetical protein
MDAVPESSSAGVGNVELVSRSVVPEESVIDREFQLTQKPLLGPWTMGTLTRSPAHLVLSYPPKMISPEAASAQAN